MFRFCVAVSQNQAISSCGFCDISFHKQRTGCLFFSSCSLFSPFIVYIINKPISSFSPFIYCFNTIPLFLLTYSTPVQIRRHFVSGLWKWLQWSPQFAPQYVLIKFPRFTYHPLGFHLPMLPSRLGLCLLQAWLFRRCRRNLEFRLCQREFPAGVNTWDGEGVLSFPWWRLLLMVLRLRLLRGWNFLFSYFGFCCFCIFFHKPFWILIMSLWFFECRSKGFLERFPFLITGFFFFMW